MTSTRDFVAASFAAVLLFQYVFEVLGLALSLGLTIVVTFLSHVSFLPRSFTTLLPALHHLRFLLFPNLESLPSFSEKLTYAFRRGVEEEPLVLRTSALNLPFLLKLHYNFTSLFRSVP